MLRLDFSYLKISVILVLVPCGSTMSMQSNKHSYFMDSGAENELVDMLASKGYMPPDDNNLPKISMVKSIDNDVAYLLSKLSDEELIRLLNQQPKKNEYDLNDIMKMTFDLKYLQENNVESNFKENEPREKNRDNERTHSILTNKGTVADKPKIAVFKLENKQVDPFSVNAHSDPNYNAIQKLSNMLYSRPLELQKDGKSSEDEEKKDLLFDVLVSQLKMLCCKRPGKHETKKYSYKNILNNFIRGSQNNKITMHEHLFLIINDEIKSNTSNELVSVDPESLERNSSVLLLGPITAPLSDSQLKLVMNRLTDELSKPEYLPLIQQLSDGTLNGSNIGLMKSLVTGPETRRYIKPHRCNHQSKLARIYGGPKWLICTGYLNLNTPSLYD